MRKPIVNHQIPKRKDEKTYDKLSDSYEKTYGKPSDSYEKR